MFPGHIEETFCGNGTVCHDVCYKTDLSSRYINFDGSRRSPTCIAIYIGEGWMLETDKYKERDLVKKLFNKVENDFDLRPNYCYNSEFYPRDDPINYPRIPYQIIL